MTLLGRMQSMLARLYDAPVEYDIHNFLLCDPSQVHALTGESPDAHRDEQVLILHEQDRLHVSVYLDPGVLERLQRSDPLQCGLEENNLSDFCTALEGVSHFHYLMWSVSRGRTVSLLELELQAEVDKYASALTLLLQQRDGAFPRELHARLFSAVSFLPQDDPSVRRRYEEASRHAARFCRALDERYLISRRRRPEAWLGAMRRFFRSGHHEKIRALAV